MPPAARAGDMHTCPMVTPGTPPVPHVGGPISPPGCPTVLIGGQPAARVGDLCVCVGPPDNIVMGSPTVLIGNMMAARLGDPTAHGGIITIGCPTVMIGNVGGPGLLTPGVTPSVTDLQNNPVVQNAIAQAWLDSQVDDPANRHEEGGWIYMNPTTGQVTVLRAPAGAQATVNLDNPQTVPDSVVVGVFHTHPNPTSEGWDPGPSPADRQIDARDGIPDLIRADDGLHFSGPNSRRGGLGGGPGYPP